jgi:O-antigen/teichoic acid export membrane protein
MTQITQRLLRGAAAQGFSQVVQTIIQITSVPLFLHAWGVQAYGEWLTLSALQAYLAMADGGIATAANHEMAISVARNDHPEALRVFQTNAFITVGLTIFAGLIVFLLACMMPGAALLSLKQIGGLEAKRVVFLLGIQVLLAQHTNLIYCGFFCERRYGPGTMAMSLIRSFEFALVVGGVGLLKGGPTAAAGALVLGRVLGNVGMWLYLRATSPWITLRGWHVDRSRIRPTLRQSVAFTLFPLGNGINLQGAVLVVNFFAGSVAVVAFTTLRTFARAVTLGLMPVPRIIQAEISSAFGRNDSSTLTALHRNACQWSLWGAAILSLSLAVVSQPVLRLWTHGRVPVEYSVLLPLLGASAANALWTTSLMVEYATNRHQWIALTYIILSVGALLVLCALTARFGVPGAAFGSLFLEVTLTYTVISRALHRLGEPWTRFVQSIIRPPRIMPLLSVFPRFQATR